MTDQPDIAARILGAVETARTEALDNIRSILAEETAPDAVAPSPKAPQSQDAEPAPDGRRSRVVAAIDEAFDAWNPDETEDAYLSSHLADAVMAVRDAELAALRAEQEEYEETVVGDLNETNVTLTKQAHEARVRAEQAEAERDQLRAALLPLLAALDEDEAGQQIVRTRPANDVEQPGPDAADAVVHLVNQREDLRHQIRDLQTTLARVRETVERWRYVHDRKQVSEELLTALNPPAEKPKCKRCKDRGVVPNWQDWNREYGEPRPKPCPDCQPKEN